MFLPDLGSEFCIQDQKDPGSGSASKNPGCSSRIRIFFYLGFRMQGGPKSTGSVSETLEKSKVAGQIRRKNDYRLEAHLLMLRLSNVLYSSATQAWMLPVFLSLPSFFVAGSILSVFARKWSSLSKRNVSLWTY